MLELYHLTGDANYLDIMFRTQKWYYEHNGAKFYPNGIFIVEIIKALQKAGKSQAVAELMMLYRSHVDNIIENSTNYPKHEVNFEQTIVAPAATYACQFYMLTGEKPYLAESKKHMAVPERFNGR